MWTVVPDRNINNRDFRGKRTPSFWVYSDTGSSDNMRMAPCFLRYKRHPLHFKRNRQTPERRFPTRVPMPPARGGPPKFLFRDKTYLTL